MNGAALPPGGRFVLLEHAWDGVHWDFMLESGDVLRTWALASRPRTGLEIPIPARKLPDHRLAYLSYEGPISGDRGSVRRVAEGTYRLITSAENCVELELTGDQLVGTVALYRAGLSGSSSDGSGWIFRLGNAD